MTSPFVLGVLSRGRPEWVRRCIGSALALASPSLHVVVAVDEDYTAFDMLPAYPRMAKALLSPRHYYCAGMNTLYQLMKSQAAASGFPLDYFAVVNDDVEFLAPDWDNGLRKFLDTTFPDGEGIAEFVGLDKCAHYATRAAFIDREFNGQLAAPGYVMYCSDSEMLVRSKKLGRYIFAEPDTRLGRAAIHYETWDAVRYEVRKWYDIDRTVFESRNPKEVS